MNQSRGQRRSVYIAYTGGTIGMRPGSRGYRPEPGFLADQMSRLPVFADARMPSYTVHEYAPLLDSSNMTPEDWVKIGEDIYDHYDRYDGFIVLHGTDTMAFSASALSFMLQRLGKPVIFTGSQIPFMELRTDARENLVTSLLLASQHPLPEVSLFVGSRLLRANRSTKVSANRFLAFDSPNYPPLGRAGVDLEIYHGRARSRPQGDIAFRPVRDARVADLRLFPGITVDILHRILDSPLQGLVLHTYGSGNAPDDPAFLDTLREACDRGMVIVNCTQCLEGSVDMWGYATGRALLDAGVVSGFDMTPEAALTKLYWLLSLDHPVEEVRRLMQESLRGELTRPQA
ncbi:MAG: asparaginase [Acidobacteriota bacterium]